MIEIEKCLTQNALTVGMIVNCHLSLKTIDLCIVENVSKIINQHQEVVVAAMVEDQVAAAMVEDQVAAAMVEDQVAAAMVEDQVEEMIDHEKCLTQNALTVEMIVNYHSNQKKTDLCIVENVSKITDKITKLFSVSIIHN
jgi:predicted phosphoribosyltransferase